MDITEAAAGELGPGPATSYPAGKKYATRTRPGFGHSPPSC